MALLAAALVSTSALADPVDKHEPIPGKQDPRIRTFPFDPANTMRLTSPGLTPVRVIFADGSVPITTAGSLVTIDSKTATDWFATKAGNTLLLQPLHENMPTSILFVTTEHGADRNNYVIELHVGTGDLTNPADTSAYFEVIYSYPKVEAADAIEARARAGRAITEGKVRTSLTQARFSAPRQWHYSKMGADCATLTPSGWNWISDDGHQTTLLFPPHMSGSAFFSRDRDDDKNESLITPIPTTTNVGTLDVLPGVYKQIVLRRDDKVCALRADAYDPNGTQPGGGSGTISPDVVRIVRAPAR